MVSIFHVIVHCVLILIGFLAGYSYKKGCDK